MFATTWGRLAEAGMMPLSIHAALRARCDASPNADAIVTVEERVSFARFNEHVEVAMSFLVREGWDPSLVTGIAIAHPQLHLIYSMALLCLGSPHVSLASFETSVSNLKVMEALNIRFVVCDRVEAWMAGARLAHVRGEAPEQHVSSAFSLPRDGREVAPSAAAIIVKTSGSTAAPRLFEISVERLLGYARGAAEDENQRRFLRTTSAEFDGTRIYRLYALLGGRPAIIGPPRIADLGAFCAEFDITRVHAFAYFLNSLTAKGGVSTRMPAGTSIIAGGSRIPGELREAVRQQLSGDLWVNYATSEVGPISVAAPQQHARYPEGVGYPVPGAEVDILGQNGQPAAPDEIGEIRVRIAHAPRSYVDNGGEQFRDGWFYPGDLVSRSPDGPLIYHGRIDDVMLLNGIKVLPTAIEDTLLAIPDVAEAVAFPLDSRVHGQIPVAAVRLVPGTPWKENALLRHCRERLGLRAPRRIILVDQIPRTYVGKPLRRALAELYR